MLRILIIVLLTCLGCLSRPIATTPRGRLEVLDAEVNSLINQRKWDAAIEKSLEWSKFGIEMNLHSDDRLGRLFRVRIKISAGRWEEALKDLKALETTWSEHDMSLRYEFYKIYQNGPPGIKDDEKAEECLRIIVQQIDKSRFPQPQLE